MYRQKVQLGQPEPLSNRRCSDARGVSTSVEGRGILMIGRSLDGGDPLTTLATALERLGARITRDFNPEAHEGVLPADQGWESTILALVAYSEECLSVLDEPSVSAALSTVPDPL